MLVERPFHDAIVIFDEKNGHVVNQVLDSVSTDTAEEIPKVLAVFFEFAIDINVRAA